MFLQIKTQSGRNQTKIRISPAGLHANYFPSCTNTFFFKETKKEIHQILKLKNKKKIKKINKKKTTENTSPIRTALNMCAGLWSNVLFCSSTPVILFPSGSAVPLFFSVLLGENYSPAVFMSCKSRICANLYAGDASRQGKKHSVVLASETYQISNTSWTAKLENLDYTR